MDKLKISLNSDMGEGLDNDHQIMPLISLCNVACGGHAGNIESMKCVVDLAIQHQVCIGAHPSFPDRKNFGRRIIDISLSKLKDSLYQQIETFLNIVEQNNRVLYHIKPHGALYHLVSSSHRHAEMIIGLIQSLKLTCYLFVPYKSVIAQIVKSTEIPFIVEAFIDRAYHNDYRLVSRNFEGSVLSDANEIVTRLNSMIVENRLKTREGKFIDIKADTYCIHSDSPNVINILEQVNEEFDIIKFV